MTNAVKKTGGTMIGMAVENETIPLRIPIKLRKRAGRREVVVV